MLSIKNNMMAANAARNLGASYNSLSKSVERLSSGQRINSAKDDAAGLAVRELIRADVAQLGQASRNAQDGVSMLQTAEGAMGVIDNLLVRMKELAEQASTGSYSDEQKGIMNSEFGQLGDEITRIANSTKFNGKALLDTSQGNFSFHLGSGMIDITGKDMTTLGLGLGGAKETLVGLGVQARGAPYWLGDDPDDKITLTFDNAADDILEIGVTGAMTLDQVVTSINNASRAKIDGWNAASASYDAGTGLFSLKVESSVSGDDTAVAVANTGAVLWGAGTGLATAVADANFQHVTGNGTAVDLTLDPATALQAVTTAITRKDSFRAELGYKMNRLDAATSILDIQAENLSTAESRISDADVATEMAAMTRNQVLAQAGISMLAQANSMPQMALKLLG